MTTGAVPLGDHGSLAWGTWAPLSADLREIHSIGWTIPPSMHRGGAGPSPEEEENWAWQGLRDKSLWVIDRAGLISSLSPLIFLHAF